MDLLNLFCYQLRIIGLCSLCVLTFLTGEYAKTAPAQTLYYSLPFRAWSGSYLPLNRGDIVNKRLTNGSSPSLSLLEKFDTTRSQLFGRETILTPDLRNKFFSESAENWSGFCTFWSSASLQSYFASLLSNTRSIDCRGISFSNGELRELFTALLSLYDDHWQLEMIDEQAYNEKIGLISQETPDHLKLRQYYGINWLFPEKFHKVVTHELLNKRGVVIDIGKGKQVWNQPVWRATITLNTPTLQDVEKYLDRSLEISSFLKATDPRTNKSLSCLQSADRWLSIYYINDFYSRITGSFPMDRFRKILNKEPSCRGYIPINDNSISPTDKVLKFRKILLNDMDFNAISLRADTKVTAVQSTLAYSVESAFAEGKDSAEKVTYNYFLFEEDKEYIAGMWLTPIEERPSYVALPKLFDWQQLSSNLNNTAPLIDFIHFFSSCKTNGN